MPMRSQAQRRYLHATHPQLAAEFERATPKGKKLPARVGKRKPGRDAVAHAFKRGVSRSEATEERNEPVDNAAEERAERRRNRRR